MFQVIQNPISDADDARLRNWLKAEGAILARRVVLDEITKLESDACDAHLKSMEGFEKYPEVEAKCWKEIAKRKAFLEIHHALSIQPDQFTTATLQKS